VITRSNRMIESRINHYLGVMNSKFTINAMEGFDFEAIFPHGIGRDSELSVGQKTALAWAFRLAGCETFSSSAGFMTMDEPSAPMDSKVLQGFINVIGILKELAASHGMQFLIATHSPEIVQECDQIIKIK
jgi:ABC-type lipoprotein export system ATPase subunit